MCSYLPDARKISKPKRRSLKGVQLELLRLQEFVGQLKNAQSNDVRLDLLNQMSLPNPDDANQKAEGDNQYIDGSDTGSERLENIHQRNTSSTPGATLVNRERQAQSRSGPHVLLDEEGNLAMHGPSSAIYPKFMSIVSDANIPSSSNISTNNQLDLEVIRAQLVANASLQRQKEMVNIYERKFDFDGLDFNTAFHLFDIHWNRQHCVYLISYRPAIMDSLATNGPYANRLLLNAIFFSSTLYSDRVYLRGDPDDPQTIGARFYKRFSQLLVHELDRPSIPTICGLLFIGAALVSVGRSTAGWLYCGLAYRMLIAIGCHLDFGSDGGSSNFTVMDIEIRKRVFWGAYINDKVQSIYLGRPTSLHSFDGCVSKNLLDTYEEFELWQPYVDPVVPPIIPVQPYHPMPLYSLSTFQALVKLAEIMAELLPSFYALESVKTSAGNRTFIVDKLDNDLDQWLTELPPHLLFNPDTGPIPPPHRIFLL